MFGSVFLLKITSWPAVTMVQLVRAETFPIISRPSAAKVVRSSPVSFLKSFAVTQTLSPTDRLVSADASASSVSRVMICIPLNISVGRPSSKLVDVAPDQHEQQRCRRGSDQAENNIHQSLLRLYVS